MLKCIRVSSLAVLASISASLAWSDEQAVPYEDAIVSVSQFDQQLLEQGDSQELAGIIASIRLGDSQKDIDALMGAPYSVELLSNGTRWDYNISVPASSTSFMGCQYRLEFDEKSLLRSADWHKSVCDMLYQQALSTNSSVPERQVEVFSLLSDVLFSFNQYQLSQNGTQSLDRFIDQLLTRYHNPVVTITGHTDQIGSAEANERLSKLRAREVGRRFVAKGLDQAHVLIKGVGETVPVVVCESKQEDSALIECLAPNRRVEIEVYESPRSS